MINCVTDIDIVVHRRASLFSCSSSISIGSEAAGLVAVSFSCHSIPRRHISSLDVPRVLRD